MFLHLAYVAQELTYILLNHGISEAFPNGTGYVYAGKPNLWHDFILESLIPVSLAAFYWSGGPWSFYKFKLLNSIYFI